MSKLVKAITKPVKKVVGEVFDVVGLIPDAPKINMPGPAPTPDNSAEELAAAAEAQRKARGRAATVLTGSQGLIGEPTVARRTLLGS